MSILLGLNAHLPADWLIDKVADLGLTWMRCDFNWDHIQAQGPDHWDFELTDAITKRAGECGISIYPTLSHTPLWANNGAGRGRPATSIDTWTRFVRAVATRYQGNIQYWGVWNEFQGNVDEYINRLLKPAAETFRAVSQDNRVCGADMATTGTWRPWLQTLLEQGRPWLDVLTVHAYGTPGRMVRNRLLEVRQVMGWASAMDVPVALSEFGWNTARISEAQQADYLDQALESIQSMPWLIAALYFNLINEPPKHPGEPSQVQWGLFRDNGTPKPAAEVMRRYAGRHGSNI